MSNEYNHEAQTSLAVPQGDLVEVIGMKGGKEHHLGTMRMPPRMKAREIAREQFGGFVDGDGSDAELCFGALEQLIDYMQATPAAQSQPAVPQGVIYEKADSLYKRGYTDRQTGKDYDPRGCDEWQEVVDWLTTAAPVQEPAVPQGNDPAWTLAAKVREALDRKACPGYYMDVAVEAVVHNYAPTAPSQEPGKCAQCKKPYRKGANTEGCPKCAPGVVVPESEFQKPISAPSQPAVPQGEPLGYINAGHLHEIQSGRVPYVYVYAAPGVGAEVPVYTTPSQPVTLTLTHEEIRDALEAEFLGEASNRVWEDDLRISLAIIAALREKGGV